MIVRGRQVAGQVELLFCGSSDLTKAQRFAQIKRPEQTPSESSIQAVYCHHKTDKISL